LQCLYCRISHDQLLEQYSELLSGKPGDLSLTRQAEISLYTSLIYIGLQNFKAAQKALMSVIIRGKSFYTFPLYRTIRLVNLIIQYEAGNLDIIRFESRSIKRELSKAEKAYRVERLMLNFLNKPKKKIFLVQREKAWQKIEPELTDLRNDVYENQLLKLFDFTAWIESQIRKIPLSDVFHMATCSLEFEYEIDQSFLPELIREIEFAMSHHFPFSKASADYYQSANYIPCTIFFSPTATG
jgi:hypothetical protein